MSVPDVALAGALLLIARSSARTVVVAMAVLLVRFGSKVVAELTVAVLESVLPSSAAGLTWTPRVKVAVAPLANEPMVQFTVPVEPAAGVVQLQPAGVGIDWNVVSAGSGSFIVTLAAAFGPALLTVIVYVSVPPGVTGSGESVLVIARLASARTVVVAVALLLPVLESAVVELTVAVLVSVLPSAVSGLTWTPRVKVAVAPLANEPMVQFTVPVEPAAGVVQLQPAGVGIDWNVVSAGSGSFIVTLAAAFGPALLTVIVYVSVPPGVTGSGESVLVIARLASARTVVVAMAVLLVRFGSKVVAELTVAVLESVLPSSAAGLTWTPRVKVAVAPLANEPMVQFTVPVEPAAGVVQLQPAGVGIDWNVVSAGSGSFIVTLAAAFGPALLTVIVYVSVPPGVTGSGESVLVIARLASARTVVVAVALLLPVLESAVVELTVAVLVSVLPSAVSGL